MHDLEGLEPLLANLLDSLPVLVGVFAVFVEFFLRDGQKKIAEHILFFYLIQKLEQVSILGQTWVILLVLLRFVRRFLTILVQVPEHFVNII